MIQIRKEENQKKQKEKKLKVYKVNTHKKTVIALWVLLAVSFLFAVYKNFTAIDIHTVHETKVIEEQILDTHKIENFVENFAEVYYSWEQSAASIDNRTNALKGYLTGELQALNVLNGHHIPDIITICERKRWEDEFNDKYGNQDNQGLGKVRRRA